MRRTRRKLAPVADDGLVTYACGYFPTWEHVSAYSRVQLGSVNGPQDYVMNDEAFEFDEQVEALSKTHSIVDAYNMVKQQWLSRNKNGTSSKGSHPLQVCVKK